MRGAVSAILAALAGCAGAPPADGGPLRVRGAGSCDASKAQSLIGAPPSAALAARARNLARAGAVRWLRPGQIVTMEYRADRLNLVLDAQNRVSAIRCG